MNNRGDNDFEELEPRVTPQPTILKCMSAPSVPEVSILFGKRSEAPQHPQLKPPTRAAEEEYETYASWKKDEFPASADPRNALKLLDRSVINGSPTPRGKSSPNDLRDFAANAKFHDSPRKNSPQDRQSQSRNAQNSARIADNLRFRNYEQIAQNEISSLPIKRADSPQQKKYDVVKSILKSSQFDRTEATNSSSSPDRRLQRKNPAQIGQTPRNAVTDLSRSARGNRQIDASDDRGTVQDLLLLVQSQNEQIRTLQNQVERLLKAHEESLANRETRFSAARRSADFSQSPARDSDGGREKVRGNRETRVCAAIGATDFSQLPIYAAADDENARGDREIPISAARRPADFPELADFSRSADFSQPSKSPYPPNEQQPMQNEQRMRHQGEPIRNAIVEQKVSIGVMTSFEFSVHNNPFDADQQINAVFRECGTYGDVAAENRRRNIPPILSAALENINEDSESHPSSVQLSSNSKRNSAVDDARDRQDRPPIFGANDAGNFADRSAQPPVPAPRKLSVSNRDRRRSAESAGADCRSPGADRSADRESRDLRRVQDRNNYNRASPQALADFYAPEIGRSPAEFPEAKSTAENTDEASLVLNSSELRVTERAPSPDPSIHVEMREYSSDDENEKAKQAPKVGWTFYKNIVGQVNRILHTIPDAKDAEDNERVSDESRGEVDGREDVDSVKLATLERLKMLGISFAEHSEYTGEHVQKKVTFDSSYCPRLDYQTNLSQPTSNVTESNTSMHMKALALKYLSDEQLADLAVQKQSDGPGMKQKILNSVHATNMSLATMNYLQRYCLVSGVNSPHAEGKGHVNAIRQKKMKHVVMTKELHAQPAPRHNGFNGSTSGKREPDNILDITTLKQQPKLL